jgi:hypothetical protein
MFGSGLYFDVNSERTNKLSGLTPGIRFPNLTGPTINWASHTNRFLIRWNAVNAARLVWEYATFPGQLYAVESPDIEAHRGAPDA